MAFALFGAAPLTAQELPTFAGAHAGTLVWEGEVILADDVLILAGAELVIRPGTRVRVVPAEGTKIDPEYLSPLTELLVRGRLDIQGTAEAPVRFVIDGEVPKGEPAWAGITFDVASGRIAHAELVDAEIAIRCVASSPELTGNRIARSRYGIIAQQGSHPRITGNLIGDGEAGIFAWRGSNPSIEGNILTGLDEEALFVDESSRPQLGRNSVTGNAVGLALGPRDLAFDLAGVQGNTIELRWLDRPETGEGVR